MDPTTLQDVPISWISAIVAVVSAGVASLWKLFSIIRQHELLQQKVTYLEGDIKDIIVTFNKAEEKVEEQLSRIEEKLDAAILTIIKK